jgi:ATP-binding cassette subfamily B multidrug efflux pump
VTLLAAMTLLLTGISHWVMWEMSSLFEHVGTINDGMATLTREQKVVDEPAAVPLQVSQGEVRFDALEFAYSPGAKPVICDFNLTIAPGEKIGLVGRSGAGKSTLIVRALYGLKSAGAAFRAHLSWVCW